MRIDLEKLKEVFRTARGRRIILAIPIAVSVNILVLILFLGVGGKETSALEGGDGRSATPIAAGARGKPGPRGAGLPVKPPGSHSLGGLPAEGMEAIAGRVVAAEGRAPLAGALVRVATDMEREDDARTEWAGPYVTDAKGNFRIEGLRHAPYRLRASAPGRLDADLPSVLPGHDVEIPLTRDNGTLCRLEVRTAEGSEPLAGQSLLLEIPSEGFSLEVGSDREGRFSLTGISRASLEKANEHSQLEILVPGYCEPVLTSSPQGLVIGVRRGISISGMVVEKSTGRPIAGASVRSGSGHSVETDGSGSYQIAGVSGSLVAMMPGYAPEGQDLMEIEAEGKENHQVNFRLDRGMSLHGRVADRQGQALGGIRVSVLVDVLDFTLNDRRLEDSVKELLSSVSDAAGNYRISGLPAAALNLPGTISLEIRPPGLENGVIEDMEVAVEEGDVEHAIVLDLGGVLVGTVTTADGQAVSGAKVSVRSMQDGIAQVAATDPNGGFQFSNLPAGSYHIEVEARERSPLSQEISIPSEPLHLRLAR